MLQAVINGFFKKIVLYFNLVPFKGIVGKQFAKEYTS